MLHPDADVELQESPMILDEPDNDHEHLVRGPNELEGRITTLKIREKYLIFLIIFLMIVIFCIAAGFLWVIFGWIPLNNSSPFFKSVQVGQIVNHLQNLQNIATANNGSRSPMFGFNSSAEYVIKTLSPFYNIRKQYFALVEWKELSPPTFSSNHRSYVYQTEYVNMMYSGAGSISGKLFNVSNVGCDKGDFNGFVKGSIAIISRGICTFGQKAQLALDSGAIGAIIYNTNPAVLQASLYNRIDIPVFSVSSLVGQEILGQLDNTTISMVSKTMYTNTVTFNTLAESKTGDEKSTIVVGAHLDSVAKGPGINDNGSGSMSVLEIALQIAKVDSLKNKIIFAFWAAEELGLLGSTEYVTSLKPDEKNKIALNLNFDMIASPNYIRGVYDANTAKDEKIRKPSLQIQKIFEAHYDSLLLRYEMSEFDGRSDYGPFIENGIPASGLDSGAEKIKTVSQRENAGGVEGIAYDPCYHLACDTIFNVNLRALEEASQCAANAVFTLSTMDDLAGYLRGQ
jgi:Zn-dependent M28 family amino/carboxypeptidase